MNTPTPPNTPGARRSDPIVRALHHENLGRLMLRLAVGGLMLMHGIAKVRNFDSMMESLGGVLQKNNLPSFMAYGIYVGEVLAPVLLIIGLFTRPAAAVLAFTMVMAIYLGHRDQVFSLGKHGEWLIELPVFYLLGALAVMFLGAGRYSVSGGSAKSRWD